MLWPHHHESDPHRKVLNWEDFIPAQSEEDNTSPTQIAAYMKHLLERYEESEFIRYLVAPSPLALSGFFHCSESEIQHALLELERQGYRTETTGLAEPIVLWDPLIRADHKSSLGSSIV